MREMVDIYSTAFSTKEQLFLKRSTLQNTQHVLNTCDGGFSELFAVSLTHLCVPQHLNYKSLRMSRFCSTTGWHFFDSGSLMRAVSEHTVGPSNDAAGPWREKR